MKKLPQYVYTIQLLFFKFNNGQIDRNTLYFDLNDMQEHYQVRNVGNPLFKIKFTNSTERLVTIEEINEYLGKRDTEDYYFVINGMRSSCCLDENLEVYSI